MSEMEMLQGVNWSVVTGVASTFIAVCALVFSIYQGIQARRHNRLSVKPHLTTWTTSTPEEGRYVVELINNGLGPALIEGFTLTVDGSPVSGKQTDVFENALGIIFHGMNYRSFQSYLAQGYCMAAKERCTLVDVQFQGPSFPLPLIVGVAFDRADIDIAYKSFYGETFRFSSKLERARQPGHRPK